MGFFLIAETSEWTDWLMTIWGYVQIAIGLGFVIFVHELGHFAVAKWCGVRCDKFYLGFDIFNLKLFSFRWGETEYGIGALPLGGYVMMLGQNDNPFEETKEIREAQEAQERAEEAREAGNLEEVEEEAAKVPPSNSYASKTVFQRMAIISAGVIMNVIFAFLMIMVAFNLGVYQQKSNVYLPSSGSPAWQANIGPGDDIIKIGDKNKPTFSDLQRTVVLEDYTDGIPVTVRKQGTGVEESFRLNTQTSDEGMPIIGIIPGRTNQLAERQPTLPDSVAAKAEPAFKGNDRIVAIDGAPVNSAAEILIAFAKKSNERVLAKVEREGKSDEIEISVAPNPMKMLGFPMQLGTIEAIQKDSPASRAGLETGDLILSINDEPVGDPFGLPQRMYEIAQSENPEITLSVQRDGKPLEEPIRLTTEPKPPWISWLYQEKAPLDIPALGLACRVLSRVDSNWDQAALEKEFGKNAISEILKHQEKLAGQVISSVEFITSSESEEEWPSGVSTYYSLGEDGVDWVYLTMFFQIIPEDTLVRLQVKQGDTITLPLLASKEVGDPQRGFSFQPDVTLKVAENLSETVSLSWRASVDTLVSTLRFLQKIVLGAIPFEKSVAGPLTIFSMGSASASTGPGQLLFFLAILSINLAVVNFLPIPVLDGGHMVFLTWELIRGKPANSVVAVMLQFIGVAFIVVLMVTVIVLEVFRFVIPS
ncbi:PDZ domain-containing protein [Planctomycetales bacterium 10988]|nr:PDZ domain-containing protein [Planctomycetales bacterium 10988]